ncbi:MAG: HYR domain-containing protein [Phycisphaerae bacterium]
MYARHPFHIATLAILLALPLFASSFERLYVKPVASGSGNGSSWDNATADLQYAIDEANFSSTKEVWVAAGTYHPQRDLWGSPVNVGSEYATFAMKSDVRIFGGFLGGEADFADRNPFKNLTVLDGLNASLNVVIATEAHSVTPDARLDGFTIRGGAALGGDKGGSVKGGGMLMYYAVPRVVNCRFVENIAARAGGALYVVNPVDSPLPLGPADPNDPNLDPNQPVYTPVMLGNVEFSGNRVTDESGYGGALVVTGSAILINCAFTRNSIADTATWAGGGGAYFDSTAGPVYLFGCTFAHNEANGPHGSGGGLKRADPDPEIEQTTLIHGSIFWGNTAAAAPQIAPVDAPFVASSIVQGGWFFGIDIIEDDPRFADINKFNSRLLPDSPALDRFQSVPIPPDLIDLDADGSFDEETPTDLDGIARVDNDRMNLGAYESFDCNRNLSPDSLEIAEGTAADCNVNGLPDSCEVDSDDDGAIDDCDGCPNDNGKTEPGICGCGTTDLDSDADGTFDCDDGCPNDPAKIAAGTCGCGTADVDSDGDGTLDCLDGCPTDPRKTTPGLCGCGIADTDSDGDGTPDCRDACPQDPNKTLAGACGCGVADTDTDRDGIADCNDNCPDAANADQADSDGDGRGDVCDSGDLLIVTGCPTADIEAELADDNVGMTMRIVAPTFSGGTGDLTVTSNLPDGNFFPVGDTQVQFTARDAVGRQASCSFRVRVKLADCPELYQSNVSFLNFFGIPTACGPTCLTMIMLTLVSMAGMKRCGM